MMINSFFTSQEFENIILHSSWSDEERPDDRTLWICQLNEIVNYFVLEKTYDDCSDVFVPFLKFIEERTIREIELNGICLEDIFDQKAFEDYRKGIADFMSSSWSKVVDMVLNRQKKESGFSTSDCSAYIMTGKHFHDCAVEYPLYARMLTEYVFSVISDTVRFIHRVASHREEVYRCLCNADSSCVPRIVYVSEPLSDRHNGGQTVRILTFEDGFRFVYKPRSLQEDKSLADWITYLCNVASIDPLMTVKVLDYGEYGFAQYIEPYAFQTVEEVADFFYKEGFLLGAIFLLQGADFHAENIIAARNPIIIDAECAVKGRINDPKSVYSVVSTAILPMCICHPAYYSITSAVFEKNSSTKNLPHLNGKTASIYDYYEDFISGFEDCMAAATLETEHICEKISELFLGIPARVLSLSTVAYSFVQKALGSPERLRSAQIAERSISIVVNRESSIHSGISNLEILERKALEKLDIPYIIMNIDNDIVKDIQKHILSIDRQNIDRQKQYISFLLGPPAFPHNSMKLCKSESDDISLINDLVQDVYRSMELSYGIVVPRKKNRPYISCLSYYFAEGNLGAITALAVFLECYRTEIEESDKYRDAIKEHLYSLKKRADFKNIFSTLESGLAEGMGGTLILACILYDIGVLERDTFEKLAAEMADLVQKSLDNNRIFAFDHSFLYNYDGLCFALHRATMQRGITEQLSSRLEKLSGELAKTINYPENDAQEMLRKELQEAFDCYDSLEVSKMAGLPFSGFFFGTGGKLFRLSLVHSAERLISNYNISSELSFWFRLLY